MTGGQRVELERLARSHTAPARDVRQAKVLLWPRTVFRTPRSLVGARPRRSLSVGGVAGSPRREPLRWGASGRGRPVVLGDDVVEAIVHDTLHTVPEDGSACWSTRSMAARYGVGKDTVARIWQARRIRPWKVETFKLSTDPSFESKLRDVVGLYVNPPAAAAVFCFDEETQVQALDRTQPSPPMVPQSLDQHQLHLRRRIRNPYRLLGLPLKRQPRALRLDQTRRRDPRQSRPRTSHPRPDHQIRDTPLDAQLPHGPARSGSRRPNS